MRTKIMDGARMLFREKGYSNVTMRAIGRRVGCSAAAIYRHFRNKREIMDALRHEGFERLVEIVQFEMVSTDPVQRLVEFGRGYVRFALAHPDAFALMYDLAGQGPEELMDYESEPMEGYAFFTNLVQEAVQSGKLGDVDQETLRFSLWSTVHGLSCLVNSGRLKIVHGSVDELELLDRMLRWVVHSDRS
ncbi:transcriptional regulator, TetR family [Paucidesulfovibrio gracilis DSM 16080]|uniref:Transcriptional regulator, TetR family n=1 Tax=Paucidesulfovibrio gracilis DSM 16080 TaxID=1121449 RepID=A0A1T4XYN6_9BACT|nr:TetR/AcrR family transcriptional regulator [Paucidesulfovibrio gracilis]SKA94660.1 transcriptional regulator, TetR family [Paucidesulfovibrio gracilis DSM 16080]